MDHTYTTTVPQQETLPPREEALEPLIGLLVDAAEALNRQIGTDWMAEQLTELERDLVLLTARYLNQLMVHGLGLWEPLTNGSRPGETGWRQ